MPEVWDLGLQSLGCKVGVQVRKAWDFWNEELGDLGDLAWIFRLRQLHMGGCQKYGPFLDPYYNTAPNI